jgi:hypothetical protein
MDIKEFCEADSDEVLQSRLKNSKDIYDNMLKYFADPDSIGNMTQAIKEGVVGELPEEGLILAVGFLANALNIEVIKKEIFRREMEDAV